MSQLVELQRLLTEERRDDVQILAVSVDTHEESRALLERLDTEAADPNLAGLADEAGGRAPFPLLEDAGHRVIDRYGLRNPRSNEGWPHPATFVIDREGRVRWRFVEIDYKVRASNEAILAALAEMGQPAAD